MSVDSITIHSVIPPSSLQYSSANTVITAHCISVLLHIYSFDTVIFSYLELSILFTKFKDSTSLRICRCFNPADFIRSPYVSLTGNVVEKSIPSIHLNLVIRTKQICCQVGTQPINGYSAGLHPPLKLQVRPSLRFAVTEVQAAIHYRTMPLKLHRARSRTKTCCIEELM